MFFGRLRRFVRHDALADTARCIRCTIAFVQLHVRDDAIARSPSCNEVGTPSRATRLAAKGDAALSGS